MTLSHNRAIGTMVLVTLMWSTAGVVTRHLDGARSFEITFWRSLFTALTLLVLVPLLRGRRVWSDMRRAGFAFWASSLCWSVMFTAFMVALTLTSVANVLVTMATGPLLTALIARVFIGHRIPRRTWAAIAVAGCGVLIMYGTQVSVVQMLGTAVALCVPIAGASNWTLTQHAHAQGHDVDLVPAVLVGAVLSCLYTLPFAFPFQASAHDLALLAFLGVAQLAIPCVLAVMCARVLMAPEMSLLALLEVLFGIALAWVGVGEVPRPAVMVGGTLVIGALVANELLAFQQRKKT
ncbi:MAG: hypothetical protein RIR09_877 [Pseudomonadota bacterium]